MKTHQHLTDLTLRVLLYQEDGEWVAHALEMDLLGYGKTEDEALEELRSLVTMQVTFAWQQNDSNLIYFPAPKEFFDRWEKAQEQKLRGQVAGVVRARFEAHSAIVTIPQPELSKRAARQKFAKLAEPVGA